MAQDTTLSFDNWTKLANAAGLGGVDAWNLWQFYDTTVSRLAQLESGGLLSTVVLDVSRAPYLADDTGGSNARAAIQQAIDDVSVTGGAVYFPPGTYRVDIDPATLVSLAITDKANVRLFGEYGLSVLTHPTGMPNAKRPLLRVMNSTNVVIERLVFDGNWGWTEGTDGQGGRNHTTQTDPGNYGIMLRTANNCLVQQNMFRDMYGDCMWIGSGGGTKYSVGCRDLRILNNDMYTAARDGIAFAQQAEDVLISGNTIRNTYSQCIDFEPVEQGCRNVIIENNDLQIWWAADSEFRSTNIAIACAGGKFTAPGEGGLLRNIRINNNRMNGGILVEAAKDVHVTNNRVTCNFDWYGYSPITVQMYTDDVVITGNTCQIVFRQAPGVGVDRINDIQVQVFGSGTTNQSPANVTVRNNVIHCQGLRMGVKVEGTGGPSLSTGALNIGETGTITTITEVTAIPSGTSTLFVSGKAWTPGQWTGYYVRCGRAIAAIGGNTADTLLLWMETESTSPAAEDKLSAWTDFVGEPIDLPLAGATYLIYADTGLVDVSDNLIDCSDLGDGNGGDGIQVNAFRAGQRCRIRGNTVKNANNSGISIINYDANRKFKLLEIIDNTVYDDQLVGTCTRVIDNSNSDVANTLGADKVVIRGNTGSTYLVAGVPTAMTTLNGVTGGWWMVSDGRASEWEGFGTPEGTVTAPVGSRAYRLDGGATTTLYIKTSGTGNTGWTAK